MSAAWLVSAALAAAPALAQGPAVRVLSAPDCPGRAELEAALDRQAVRRLDPASTSSAALGLRVRAERGRLLLELDSQPPSSREIPATGEQCSTLAETCALIVGSWLRALPWRGAEALPAPPPLATRTGSTARTATAAAPQPPAEPLSLTLELSGGAALGLAEGSPASWSAQGGAALGLGPRLELLLAAGARARLRAALAPGEVSYRRVPILAGLRYALRPRGEGGLSLAGGALLELIAAAGAGYAQNEQHLLVAPGAFAAVRWSWVLGARVEAYLELQVPVLLVRDALAVDALGVAITTPRAWLEANAGLRLRVF